MGYVRLQIYLDPADHRRLKLAAGRKNVSMAELVRGLVADYLAGDTEQQQFTRDVFMSIVGLGESLDTSGAVEHDWHLGEALSDEHTR